MRPWVEQAYGIPPEQVVGSRGKLKYELGNGKPGLFKLPEPELVDDGPGKPVGIAQMIGRRPYSATPTAISKCSSRSSRQAFDDRESCQRHCVLGGHVRWRPAERRIRAVFAGIYLSRRSL